MLPGHPLDRQGVRFATPPPRRPVRKLSCDDGELLASFSHGLRVHTLARPAARLTAPPRGSKREITRVGADSIRGTGRTERLLEAEEAKTLAAAAAAAAAAGHGENS